MHNTEEMSEAPVDMSILKSEEMMSLKVDVVEVKEGAPNMTEHTSSLTKTFVPQLVESSVISPQGNTQEELDILGQPDGQGEPEAMQDIVTSTATDKLVKAPRRFAVQPIETSMKSSRDKRHNDSGDGESLASPAGARFSKKGKKAPRKFAPQLIETAKRSRKTGDETPAVLPVDHTEATPEQRFSRPRERRRSPTTRPSPTNHTYVSQSSLSQHMRELRRIGSPLSSIRSPSQASSRSHCFQVPMLEPIESSESGDSGSPSLSTSPTSSLEGIAEDHMYKHATRMRESADERFSGYMLQLAARAAETQLKDAAMAAFPNSDFHEPVDHFIDHDSDEGISAEPSRHNTAFTKVNWELKEMQQHHGRMQEEKERGREQLKRDTALMSSRGPTGDESAPWQNPVMDFLAENDISNKSNASKTSGYQKEIGMKQMRENARPPLLGADIVFPRSESPDRARFDVTQGSEHLRTQMCYLTGQAQSSQSSGLWADHLASTCMGPTMWSTASSRQPSNHSVASGAGGLWSGLCKASNDHSPPTTFQGIMTPARRPVSQSSTTDSRTQSLRHLPSTPSASRKPTGIANLDSQLLHATSASPPKSSLASRPPSPSPSPPPTLQSIQQEYPDSFITQVYNYLSLGHPSIAHSFDAELAKISGLDIEELQQDDYLAKSKGYIRLGAEDGRDGIEEEMCARWRALRLYVWEWARQAPNMKAGGMLEEGKGWGQGVGERKGSWGW